MQLKTPYYLLDESKLLRNLKIIERVRELSGAISVLAVELFHIADNHPNRKAEEII